MLKKLPDDYEEDYFDPTGGIGFIILLALISGTLIILGIWKLFELLSYFVFC